MYKSEADRFIDELKRSHPQIEEQQRKNRATWWDKPQDLDAIEERAAATVPQPGYVYFPLPRKQGDDPDSGGQVAAPARPA